MAKSPVKRILLVEDDGPTSEAILFKLKKAGFETDYAEDGQIGLEKLLQDSHFDVILLDLRMPKGDGFSFLEKKKKEPAIRNIPVIVFTNLHQREFVDRALELGAVGYLIKAHHSLDDIIGELKRCLAKNKCGVDY